MNRVQVFRCPGRVVVSGLYLAGSVVAAIAVPNTLEEGGVADRLVVEAWCLGVAVFSLRGALVRIVLDDDGVRIFNFWRTYVIPWSDIRGMELLRSRTSNTACVWVNVQGKRIRVYALSYIGKPPVFGNGWQSRGYGALFRRWKVKTGRRRASLGVRVE